MLAPGVRPPTPALPFWKRVAMEVSQLPCRVQGWRSFNGCFVCMPIGARGFEGTRALVPRPWEEGRGRKGGGTSWVR